MKVLLKSAMPCLLALLLFSNNICCMAADQALANNVLPAPIDTASPEQAPNISSLHTQQRFVLSAVAYDMAQQLSAGPLIEQLRTLQSERGLDQAAEIKRLQLKQKLTDTILIATLQVRDVTARIERESSHLNRILGYLEDRRDRGLKLNTISNALGMGIVNTTGQALEMKSNEVPGEITQVIGGGIVMLLSAWSLHQQSGAKHQVTAKPNMLSKAFNYKTDADSEYPILVWNYLNRVPLNDPTKQTRLESMFQNWKRYGIIGNKKGAMQVNRTVRLTNTGEKCMESIDLIGDQLALLSDLKAEIYQLDRDLLELLLNTQAL